MAMSEKEILSYLEISKLPPGYKGTSVSYDIAKEWADELIKLRKVVEAARLIEKHYSGFATAGGIWSYIPQLQQALKDYDNA